MINLIRLKSCFLYSVFMYLVLLNHLVAQSSNTTSFELSRYEFEAGVSESVDLTFTLKGPQANVLEIQNPFGYSAVVVESARKVSGGNSTDLWFTKDSTLFAKNLPQTALVFTKQNSTVIQTAAVMQNNDRLVIRLIIAVPRKDRVKSSDSLSSRSSRAENKYMYVMVSQNPSPGTVTKYMSAKPIVIKQGTVK